MRSLSPLNAQNIVIIGASGFVGEYLLKFLIKCKNVKISVLVHSKKIEHHSSINFVEGDLLRPESLESLISKNCTVINLAYLPQNNIDAIVNLVDVCAKKKIKRLIHISTAVVCGSGGEDIVNENTSCTPISEYQKNKLNIENLLLKSVAGKFEISILRPTAIFGIGGKNLLKMTNRLLKSNGFINYLWSCFMSKRSLNLVCVENVIAAIVFLIDAKSIDRQIFIISDDKSDANNYLEVEKRLFAVFNKNYIVPRIVMPGFFLSLLLKLLGKDNTNPAKKYSDKKLTSIGFNKVQEFEIAIERFAMAYKNSRES